MPLIGIHPKREDIEQHIEKLMHFLRPELKRVVGRISGFPESDVIVNLHKCSTADADPNASDFVVKAETNPNEDLESVANVLRDAIAKVFIDAGLTDYLVAEFWPLFLPGSWCMITQREIVHKVDHPKDRGGRSVKATLNHAAFLVVEGKMKDAVEFFELEFQWHLVPEKSTDADWGTVRFVECPNGDGPAIFVQLTELKGISLDNVPGFHPGIAVPDPESKAKEITNHYSIPWDEVECLPGNKYMFKLPSLACQIELVPA